MRQVTSPTGLRAMPEQESLFGGDAYVCQEVDQATQELIRRGKPSVPALRAALWPGKSRDLRSPQWRNAGWLLEAYAAIEGIKGFRGFRGFRASGASGASGLPGLPGLPGFRGFRGLPGQTAASWCILGGRGQRCSVPGHLVAVFVRGLGCQERPKRVSRSVIKSSSPNGRHPNVHARISSMVSAASGVADISRHDVAPPARSKNSVSST